MFRLRIPAASLLKSGDESARKYGYLAILGTEFSSKRLGENHDAFDHKLPLKLEEG
jgi:hypothetical protein